jgi:hypothetical protein
LEDQRNRGWAIKTTLKEARDRYGEVCVAPLAIIAEKGGKLRTLLDASNKVQVNHRIHVQDAEQCPTALDVQAAVTADTDLRFPIMSLVIDVEKAHQQVPVDERDWGLVACSEFDLPKNPAMLDKWEINLKCVGTYGVASASWQWARIGSMFQRLCYYIARLPYLFRFADDFLLLACNQGGTRFTRFILRFLLICDLIDMPIKWAKTRGGLRCEFVGYLFLWESLQGGLSERRTDWLVAWTKKVADDGIIVARDLRAGLGRLAFSAALLRFLLPFLGPFYAWVAVMPDSAAWPLPDALVILLGWIGKQLVRRHLVDLRLKAPQFLGRFFKADARAEGEIVVVGGFEMYPNVNLSQCRWFSITLNPINASWAFVKEGEAYRVIASLELFATLLCVMLFVGRDEVHRTSHLTMIGVSDNKGNEALIRKNMTSKYPLYVVLLELTEQLQLRDMALDLRWQQRNSNQAADDLTNFIFKDFDASKRISIGLEDMPWLVLPELLKAAQDMHVVMMKRKVDNLGIAPMRAMHKLGKKRKAAGLRTTDPW